MFCPKCGNQLPDGSAFCGKCGARLGEGPNTAARPTAPAAGAPAPSAGVRPLAIAAAVLAAVAAIVSFMPWFEVFSGYSTVTGYVGDAASFLGLDTSSALAFDEFYAPLGLPGLAGTFSEYASLYGMFGGSNAGAAAMLVGLCSWACAALWLVAVVLLVWGAVAVVRGGTRAPMIAGAVVAVLCWVAFLVLSGMLNSLGQASAMPLVFVAASVAAAVCSLVAKAK